MKKTLEQIIDDFKNKHGDKFDYSRVVYVNIDTPVEIICPKHGMFKQTPYTHTKSNHGCPKCSIKNYITLDELKVKCFEVHGYKFLYDFKNLERDRTINVTCIKHNHTFNVKWHKHTKQDSGGCNFCLSEYRKNHLKSDIQDLKEKMSIKHNSFYDYSLITNYQNQHLKQPIKCPIHGVFYQSVSVHVKGHGCKKCSNNLSSENRRKSLAEFIEQCKIVHADKYIYSNTDYKGSDNRVIITCPIHGDFEQIANNHLKGHGCVKCFSAKSKSKYEERLEYLLDSCSIEYQSNIRPDWVGGKELDLYIPSLNLAIEFNGSVYHHSDFDFNSDFMSATIKDNSYHHNKYLKCRGKSVDLIHIFEFEDFDSWLEKIRLLILNRNSFDVVFHNVRRKVKVNNRELTYFGKSYIKKL